MQLDYFRMRESGSGLFSQQCSTPCIVDEVEVCWGSCADQHVATGGSAIRRENAGAGPSKWKGSSSRLGDPRWGAWVPDGIR